MTTSSASGGYLTPISAPALGQAFMRALQQVVVGITGMPGDLVRPWLQTEPPNIPQKGVSWASLSLHNRNGEGTAWQGWASDGVTYQVVRQETGTLVVGFYDTGITQQADLHAETLREGLQLSQNREGLDALGIGILAVDGPQVVYSKVKEQWLYRVDVTVHFRRVLTWTYNILSLESAVLSLEAQAPDGTLTTETITVTGP
jgi:hypothetical protein